MNQNCWPPLKCWRFFVHWKQNHLEPWFGMVSYLDVHQFSRVYMFDDIHGHLWQLSSIIINYHQLSNIYPIYIQHISNIYPTYIQHIQRTRSWCLHPNAPCAPEDWMSRRSSPPPTTSVSRAMRAWGCWCEGQREGRREDEWSEKSWKRRPGGFKLHHGGF